MIFKLKTGENIQIDSEDLHIVTSKVWRLDRFGYVTSHGYTNGKRTTHNLHRVILGSVDGYETDHINGDKLDNRKSNLRHVTRNQNQWNSRPYKGRSHKGAFITKFGTWQVKVGYMGKQYYFGTFKTLEEAKRVYDREARRLHGEYAVLNGGMS